MRMAKIYTTDVATGDVIHKSRDGEPMYRVTRPAERRDGEPGYVFVGIVGVGDYTGVEAKRYHDTAMVWIKIP